jgi:hypothetical protein
VLLQGAWHVAAIAAPVHVAGQPVVCVVMSVAAVGALLQVLGAAAGSISMQCSSNSQAGFDGEVELHTGCSQCTTKATSQMSASLHCTLGQRVQQLLPVHCHHATLLLKTAVSSPV